MLRRDGEVFFFGTAMGQIAFANNSAGKAVIS
jgi:hypothetical protein